MNTSVEQFKRAIREMRGGSKEPEPSSLPSVLYIEESRNLGRRIGEGTNIVLDELEIPEDRNTTSILPKYK